MTISPPHRYTIGDRRELPTAGKPVLVGRRDALDAVVQRAEQAASGSPGVALIEAEPGMGRTTLLRRLAAALPNLSTQYVACDPAETQTPFRMVEQLLGRLDPLGDPLRRPTTVEVGERLRLLLAAEQTERPVVIMIDDLHWTDQASADVLGYVLRRLRHDRVLVVLTSVVVDPQVSHIGHHPLDVPELCRRRRLVTLLHPGVEITLPRLTQTELAELARHHGYHIAPGRIADLHRYTAGNPSDSTMIFTDPHGRGFPADPTPVPTSFSGVVLDRLAPLPVQSRRLIEGLAVLDGQSRIALAAQVGGVPDPAHALEPLLRRGLVRWQPFDPVCPIEVTSPMLSAGIYGLLDPQRRRAMHAAAAEFVDADDLWRHRIAASAGVDDRLAADLERGAEAALRVGDLDRALQLLQWAADLSVTRADRERLMLRAVIHGPRVLLAKDENLRRRVERCDPSPLRDVARGLIHLHHTGDIAAAQQTLAGVSASVEPRAPALPWLANTLAVAQAEMAMSGLDGRRALTLANAVLARIGTSDLLTQLRAARSAVFGQLLVEGPGRALTDLDRLRPCPHPDASLPTTLTELVVERAVCRALAGLTTAALADADEVLLDTEGDDERGGDRMLALLTAAFAEYRLGRWTAAAAKLERALADRPSDPRLTDTARSQAAVLAANRGRTIEAQAHLVRLSTSPLGNGNPLLIATTRAGIAQARGDHPAVVAAFDTLPALSAASGYALATRIEWAPSLIEGLIEVNRPAEADVHLDALVALSIPALDVTVAWLHGLRAERAGDTDRALALYRSGTQMAVDQDETVLHRAHLELALGRLLGRKRSAVRWLRSAHGRYHAVGAEPMAHRCAALLQTRDTGVAAGASGVLTEREREVARLVACGLTNQQTASRLFVSEKTVEFHLRNAYSKLGISSRRELRTLRSEIG